MSDKTIFQKVIDGEIPGEILYQDEQCAVLRDIDPQAPMHLLVVPKVVIPRIAEAQDGQEALLGHLLRVAAKVAPENGADNGFRIVINNGQDGGETVPHLHVHVLGGRALQWPPG